MRRYLSTLYTLFKRVVGGLSRAGQPEFTTLGPDIAWARLIADANLRQLLAPPTHSLHAQRDGNWIARWDARIQRWLAQQESPFGYSWTIALNALGAQWAYRMGSSPADFAALVSFFERQIDRDGCWRTPINRVDHAMKGYSLLYVAEHTKDLKYWRAAESLAQALLTQHPRTGDGSLPYDLATRAILVDTLAMICPFLARYAVLRDDTAARELSVQQLRDFISQNVDESTHLPYHGYYADGPKHLGLHGWGRGTGWYMLGLVDTVAEFSPADSVYQPLVTAFTLAADTLRTYQRPDGHWNWAVLHRQDVLDSSTTALVGYSLMRGLMLGLLDERYEPVITAALHALISVTRADGILDGGLGECRGLGKYPQTYGPQPWLQGAATAFAVLYFKHFEGRAV